MYTVRFVSAYCTANKSIFDLYKCHIVPQRKKPGYFEISGKMKQPIPDMIVRINFFLSLIFCVHYNSKLFFHVGSFQSV